MRKSLILLAACALTLGAAAQQQNDEEGQRYWRQTHHMRDASRMHLGSHIAKAPAPKDAPAPKHTTGMPQGNYWFPGEWEEVQAIVVTPYYNYRPDSAGFTNMIADPMVTGVAAYYSSYYAQQPSAYGPYRSIIDTSSTFAQVSFYLMDAIQLGGAQAWVRVENFDDSTAVLNHLTTMGLRTGNIRFIEAPGNSFWYRDCGPICFYYGEGDTVGMLDFEYYPGRALDDSLPVYIERQIGLPNFTTQIEWEGGNCLVDGTGMVLSSDAIYENNRDTYGQLTWDGSDVSTISYTHKRSLTNAQVRDSLAELIGTRATYILPAFQNDGGTGHVDLYADMIDENGFVFSKMPDDYYQWIDYKTGRKNMDSLCSYQTIFGTNYKHRSIPFPSRDNGSNFSSQTQYDLQYTRTYSNHTFVNNVIIQPCFSTVGADGMPTAAWDRANIEEVQRAYPGYTIYCVDVRDFDGSGGAIHCITKQIPAEHPLRILHQSITGNTGNAYNAENAIIKARATNVDGIASITLSYRIGDGQWQTVPMTQGPTCAGSEYEASIPTTGTLSGQYTEVDYFITATSNAGKTIAKPMPATEQSGYYTFYIGENANSGIETAVSGEHFGQFYPNPASGEAHMQIELGNGGSYTVSIVDASGRTVHTSGLQASGSIVYTIDASRLGHGQYTVVFEGSQERVVRKLIVQ